MSVERPKCPFCGELLASKPRNGTSGRNYKRNYQCRNCGEYLSKTDYAILRTLEKIVQLLQSSVSP